ncbi:MAG TPA: M14 metallopeptidase family protein [Candidatus Krumholzibacteria bacterium]|nr:M14 metallopeptidase family protein [Candidatus Krumholzibacteria bacterium]
MRATLLAGLTGLLLALCPSSTPAGVDPQAMRVSPDPGAGDYTAPFWPGGTYREDVKSPSDFLGYPVGSKPASNPEILSYFEYLDGFPNVELHTYGETYEGRRLVYLIIASDANAGRLDEIKANCQKLADPRTLGGADPKKIIDTTPVVAWMAYGIHGDELSSCDAAMQLAYQLVAGTDDATKQILDNCVVSIDPSENPDGRTRWLAQLASWNSVIPSHDVQSISHTGMWPYGRTNHYLFDLNRDWFAQVHPETRGKTRAMMEWMPHYVLDCHEMGPYDQYLMSPPREPFNPYLTSYIHKWWDRVAKAHADAFDKFGWSYYTREWNEEMYPGYGSSYGCYLGAVGMLFEQAGVDGSQVKRPDGTIMTFRETVHHQFIASMANIAAIAANRKELLNDYFAQKQANLRSKPQTFVLIRGSNQTRLDRLVEKLEAQHIEVERTTREATLSKTRAWDGTNSASVKVPAGSAIVRTNQPLRQLVEAILAFDIRLPTAFLKTEKREILARDDSRLYDTTGWSMPLAYGIPAYQVDGVPGVATEKYVIGERRGSLTNENAKVGFVFDGVDDRAFELLARLFEHHVNVWCARKPFRAAGRDYARGSYLIRRAGNETLDVAMLRSLAENAGVDLVGVDEGLNKGIYADLGGNDFILLKAPRIALVAGSRINGYDFGAIWHLLDSRMRVRVSTLDVVNVAADDLSKYNVIVLPDNDGGAAGYKGLLGDAGVENLRSFAKAGGTLIGEGGGAAFLADSSVAISSARPREQVLKDLDRYTRATQQAAIAFAPEVDSLSVWEGKAPAGKKRSGTGEKNTEKPESPSLDALKRDDETARKLYPHGAIVAVDLNQEDWLAFGCGKVVPALLNNPLALVTDNVDVPARLAPADHLRLSGLMWEEARARWGETVYAMRDACGDGQAIVFDALPDFRGYYHGAERLLLNALFLGPGFGTATRVSW